jgi:hypothetical protein
MAPQVEESTTQKNKPPKITKVDFETLKNFFVCCFVAIRGLRLFVELQVALL